MSPKLKIVLIEDNSNSIGHLYQYLNILNADVEICGDASNIHQAVALIEWHKPHVIFMAIELNDGLCFQIVDIIRQKGSYLGELVFISTTEHYEYALKAIEYACLDFITKPITENAINRIITKAQKRLSEQTRLEHIQMLKVPKKTKLIVPTAQKTHEVVEISQITHFEANGQFTIVHLSNGKHITAFRILGYFKKLLAEDTDFRQIHHALLINTEHIKHFRTKTREIILKNGVVLEASRRLATGFKAFWSDFKKLEVH